MARPRNKDRYSPQVQRDKLRELTADALTRMKSLVQKADFQTLANFVSKALPLILNDNTQTENDVQMELLIKKAVKVQLRINEANEQYLTEEEITEDDEE